MLPSRFARLASRWIAPDAVVIEATSLCARLLGLAFLEADELSRDTGLLLPRCTSIHTFGMRFPIDVAFLDGDGRVVREIHHLPPRRVRTCRGAAACLEVHAGELWRFDGLRAKGYMGEGWRDNNRRGGFAMFRKFHIRLTYANVMATVAVVLALGGGAYVALGAIPDSKGVIHSCFKKTGGALRVISKGKCKIGESPLAWNRKGPKGAQGVRGLQGIQGIQGIPGPTASRSVTNNVPNGSEFSLGSTDTSVVDLNNVNTGNTNNQITTTFTSRIMAVGSVELIGNSTDSQCHLLISDGTGPNNGLTAISATAEHSIGPDIADAPVVVATTGGAVKPAGTYNVRYACLKSVGSPKASSASLTVWAAAS